MDEYVKFIYIVQNSSCETKQCTVWLFFSKNFWERYQAKIFSLPPFLGSPFIVDRISGAFPLPSFTFDICLGIS